MIFGDFTKSDLEKWLEKKGMETEMRENVKDFCKVAGYFINGYFTKGGGSGLYGRKGIMNLDKTRRKKNECQILC